MMPILVVIPASLNKYVSWPLYAMYSTITQEEDNDDAKRRQKDTDVILVFTGLFSATVATLLAVTIPDLKGTESSSQDASAFYLEKIYLILGNSNASVGSIPFTFSAPSPSFPPPYIVWVNTLWLLALLISLSGAALATLEREFVSRHISITQDKEHLPEMRGRIRAMLVTRPDPFFGLRRRFELLSMLHISLFLFLAGVIIYFFHINQVTFMVLAACVGFFGVLYAIFTLVPLFRPTELFYTPFSPIVFDIYVSLLKATSKVLSLVISQRKTPGAARTCYHDLNLAYKEGFIGCRTESAEKTASKPSPEIDTEVLERILVVLNNDHALEGFLDAIPAFCNSRMVHKPLDVRATIKLQQTLDAILDRTFSSPLVTESRRNDRLITCLNAAHSALGPRGVSEILGNFFNGHRDEALKSVEIGRSLVRWVHSNGELIEPSVRRIVDSIIAHPQDRDDRWAKLVQETFDIPDGVIRDCLAHGDSVLLAVLIHVTREALVADHLERHILEALSRFDIRNTSAELRHDFCALWNQIVQEARNEGVGSTPTQILATIRHLFTTLHHGTDAVPNELSASLDSIVLSQPSSYPSCNIPSHHPDSATQALALAPPTIPPPQFRRLSEPDIGVSVAQRFRSSSPSLRRTQSCCDFSTVPLATQPSYPPKSSPSPVLVTPPPLADSPDVVIKDAMPDFAAISLVTGTADPIHGSTSGSGRTVQQEEETRTSSPSIVFGSLPTPLPTPAFSHSAISAMLPSSTDPATTQTHSLHHPPGSPTLITMPLSSTQQVTKLSDQSPSSGTAREQDDIQDSRPLTPRADDYQPPPRGATIL